MKYRYDCIYRKRIYTNVLDNRVDPEEFIDEIRHQLTSMSLLNKYIEPYLKFTCAESAVLIELIAKRDCTQEELDVVESNKLRASQQIKESAINSAKELIRKYDLKIEDLIIS